VISYIAAVLTAVANAASNVLNRKATRDEPAAFEFRLRLITHLLRRRTWLAAAAMMILSFGLGAAALGTGQLAAVEPIIALELPMTVIGESWVLGSRLRKRGWAAVVTSWQLYAAIAAGAIATWLLQNAYHAGQLAAAQPGITLADPVVAVVWGVLAFGERVREGLFIVPSVLSVLAVAAAVVVLARSPRMQGAAGQSEEESRRREEHGEAA